MKKYQLFKCAILSMACIACASCNKVYYQVYTMESENLIMQDNSIVYENADCQVLYNLQSDGGLVSFAFKNKTDKDIFINLNESFLVVNGNAHDYFEDKAYTYASVSSTSYGNNLEVNLTGKNALWSNHLYTVPFSETTSKTTKTSVSKSVTVKEHEIICVPAHSYKKIAKFRLQPNLFQKCDEKIDYPSGKAKLMSYSHDDSPIIMNNRLKYGFAHDKTDKHLDNKLWLSEINNYSRKAAIEDRKEKGCYDLYSKNVKYFKIGTPSQFYRIYKRKTGKRVRGTVL